MRMYQDERRLDFHALGREIKRKREAKGWTQEYLAQLVDRTPRSICLMLRKKLFTVFAGLVLFKGRPCLGILHRCRLQFRVGMEGDFGAFDLVRQLVKTLCCRRGLLLQLLIVRQAVVLQVGKGGGHLFEIKHLGPPLIVGAFPLELGLNINSQADLLAGLAGPLAGA